MKDTESKKRSYLTKISNNIKPVIWIGKNGLTENILRATDELLNTKELIKIKFVNFKDEKLEVSQNIAKKTNSFLVRVIGNIAIFYRQAKKPEKRKIIFAE